MGMSEYRQALDECATGNLKMTVDKEGHKLFCYTQKCFFGKDTWNDITTTHRGRIYYEMKKSNHPFKKIFNIDEVDETDSEIIEHRMNEEAYEVLDKANGHLFIMSAFKDSKGKQHVVFSTKGSLPNEDNDLLNKDIIIFSDLYGERLDNLINIIPNCTLMFEAIVSHDKHSMYETQVQKYGDENCFVLLGASVNLGYDYDQSDTSFAKNTVYHSTYNSTTLEEDPWVESEWLQLASFASYIECPVIEKYNEIDGTPKMWKEHTNREGYVIRFLTNNDRVKIKTTEYWKNRSKKDLTPEKILALYTKGGPELMQEKLPEEMAESAIRVLLVRHSDWYFTKIINLKELEKFVDKHRSGLSDEDRKWLYTESLYTSHQRRYIMNRIEKKNNHISDDKTLRNEFSDFILDDIIEYEILHDYLKTVVSNAL